MTTPDEPLDADSSRAGDSADDPMSESPGGTDLGLGPEPHVAAEPEPRPIENVASASSATAAGASAVAASSPARASDPLRVGTMVPGVPAAPVVLHPLSDAERAAESNFRPRRSWGHRALLVVNCIVVTGCFVAAGVLLTARHVANSVHKVDLGLASASAPTAGPILVPATTAVGLPGTEPVVPVSTVPGETAPPVTGPTTPPETFPPADPTAQNFLITGADNNACIDPDSPYAGAFGDREAMGERSDTVMIMRVDPANTRAAILSFPRDLWVRIAGSGRQSRINSAYVRDDPRNLIQTIVDNFQVGIDHFIQVDFCAFKRLVDAVDGVAVPFEFATRDTHTGLNVPQPGCFTFDGDHALAYVRSRYYEFMDEEGNWKRDQSSDLGRVSRQQDFIRRALDAALAKGVYSPSVARGLIDIATQSIVVDTGLTIDKMMEFFGVLRNFQPGTIRTYQIEAEGQNISGNAVLVPRINGENMKSILRIFQGVAPLAGAPEQVFETTTTEPADDGSTTSTSSVSTTTTVSSDTTEVPTVTTVVDEGPEENVKGIVPPDTQC